MNKWLLWTGSFNQKLKNICYWFESIWKTSFTALSEMNQNQIEQNFYSMRSLLDSYLRKKCCLQSHISLYLFSYIFVQSNFLIHIFSFSFFLKAQLKKHPWNKPKNRLSKTPKTHTPTLFRIQTVAFLIFGSTWVEA